MLLLENRILKGMTYHYLDCVKDKGKVISHFQIENVLHEKCME
jgi:hypothetical protein